MTVDHQGNNSLTSQGSKHTNHGEGAYVKFLLSRNVV